MQASAQPALRSVWCRTERAAAHSGPKRGRHLNAGLAPAARIPPSSHPGRRLSAPGPLAPRPSESDAGKREPVPSGASRTRPFSRMAERSWRDRMALEDGIMLFFASVPTRRRRGRSEDRPLDSWLLQLLTLLGVAVGALASFMSTRALDRSRWRREEDLRWADKRLESYINFSSSIMAYITIGYRISAGLGLTKSVQPLDEATGLPALADAESALSVAWEQVMILGSPPVIRAAYAWRNEAWHLDRYARRVLHEGDGEFRKATEARRAAQRDFYAAVRADVGLAGGEVPVLPRLDYKWHQPRASADGEHPESDASPDASAV